MEYKSNDFIGQNYERKIELERLTPIGRMYLETYIRVRVDENTIKFVKPSKIMGKYHYQTTPKRKRCKTKCKYANIFVGSVECKNLCKNHKGYGRDENGKYVECAACE